MENLYSGKRDRLRLKSCHNLEVAKLIQETPTPPIAGRLVDLGPGNVKRIYLIFIFVTGFFFISVYEAQAATGIRLINPPNPAVYCANSNITVGLTSDKGGRTSFYLYIVDGPGPSAKVLEQLGVNQDLRAHNDPNVEVTFTFTVTNASTGTNRYLRAVPQQGAEKGRLFHSTLAFTVNGAPVSGGNKTVVYGEPTPALTATVYPGQTVDWYATSNATTPIASGVGTSGVESFTPTQKAVGTYTYYAQARGVTYTACPNNGRTPITLTITPKALTLAGAAAQNKVYDKTNAAVITGTLTGILGEDQVSFNGIGTFSSVNVGNNIPVTSVSTLAGTGASNYVLVQPTGLRANITPRDLTVTAIGHNKIYDGTTVATVGFKTDSISGDNIGATYVSATFVDKNVGPREINVNGISITGTDAGNYKLVNATAVTAANILLRPVEVSSVSIESRVYDGTTIAKLLGKPTLVNIVSINGVEEKVTVNNSFADATFEDKNVGIDKLVLVTGYTIEGADASNYRIVQPIGLKASITPKEITGAFTAENKKFDGTTDAIVSDRILVGHIVADAVSLKGGVATFASSEPGTWTVTLVGAALDGVDKINYTLGEVATATATITPVDPLPVTLLSFEGKQKESIVYLSWATASEKDNDYFQVERSQDGKTFGTIGKVDGNGTTNEKQEYSFTDAAAPAGTVYYRLKQVDFDGKFEYSKVIAVKADGKASAQASLQAYPNPTLGKVYVASTEGSGPATVTLFHSSGRAVSQRQVQLETGKPIADLTGQVPGIYYLQVQTNTGKSIIRVVKQ
ncbi:YDG domain-containing protein [Rufibacter roseolus]|uniref:YDG domain-containing protein n=1 Tax=Rufibacter roseolus TaxID=2817375 RepID=UPI001B30B5F5|nr:YDG domain-containing protein [Rufibacter roseolus]